MSHYRRDVVGRGISTGLGLGLRRRLSGGALPVLFGWNPEIAQALPATATFTRAFVAQVLTTTDGTTFWYQEAKSGELRLDGLRRVENFTKADINDWTDTGWVLSGTPTLTPGQGPDPDGGSDATEIEFTSQFQLASQDHNTLAGDAWADSQPVVASFYIKKISGDTSGIHFYSFNLSTGNFTDISAAVTTSWTKVQVRGITAAAATTTSFGIQDRAAAGTAIVQVSRMQIEAVQDAATAVASTEVLEETTVYNAEVAAVQYSNKTNANTVLSNVVTEATGTTITGGGYLPEPAATNLLVESTDFGDAAWTQDFLSLVDDGVGSTGLNQHTITSDSGSSNHRLFTTINYGSGGSKTVFMIVGAGTDNRLGVRTDTDGPSSNVAWTVFNLSTENVDSNASVDDAGMVELSTGIYLCWHTYTVSAAGVEFVSVCFSDTDTAPVTTTGDLVFNAAGTETLVFYHAQVEATAFSTSPIITSGSTVTRVADTLSIGISEPAAGYTAFCDATGTPVVVGGINPVVYGGAGAGRPIMIDVFTAGNPFSFTSNGISARVTDIDWRNVRLKVSVSVPNDGSSNGIISVTGGTTDTDAENTTSTDALTLGYSVGSANDQFRSPIHNAIIYGIAVDQTQNEALVV